MSYLGCRGDDAVRGARKLPGDRGWIRLVCESGESEPSIDDVLDLSEKAFDLLENLSRRERVGVDQVVRALYLALMLGKSKRDRKAFAETIVIALCASLGVKRLRSLVLEICRDLSTYLGHAFLKAFLNLAMRLFCAASAFF